MFENSNGQVKEAMPNTEVVTKITRKRFTAAGKLRILREVEACRGSGEIGVLLRWEGLYPFYLTTWRKQREAGELDGLAPHKRGLEPDRHVYGSADPGLEFFTPFIEEFYNDGITTGCAVNPLKYCPQNYVTRGEMAVFIVRAFGIPLP